LKLLVKSAVIWLALAILPGQALAKQVQLVGSYAVMDLPDGFEESRQFTGAISPSSHATILVTELPAGSFKAVAAKLLSNAKALAEKNIQLDTLKEIRQGQYPALLGRGRQQIDEQPVEKWLLLIEAPQTAMFVTAELPTLLATPDRIAAIDAALASIRVADIRSDPRGALPFILGETERFHFDRALSANTALLTEPTYTGEVSLQPIFVVTASKAADCNDGKDDMHAFANRALAGVHRVKDMTITNTYDGPIGKDTGIISEATGTMADKEVFVMQTFRVRACTYLRTIGIGPAADGDAYRAEFVKLAAQVEWKASPTETKQ
jgi:hypothetical protein